MPLIDVVKTMLQRPVAFQPILGRICGSATAGLMLSQAIYWSERTTEKDGWFYKTHNEWTEEICLSRDEQRTARKNLISLGFWKEERRGMPNKLFYRIDFEILAQAIVNHTKGKPFQLLENPQQDWEIPTTDGEIPATCEREIPNTMGKSAFLLKEAETTRDYTEITSEVEVTEKTIAVFLLKDSSQKPIKALQLDKWQKQFPKIDVKTEILAMAAWLEANPERRKTERGVPRFVVNWLKGEQGKVTGAAGRRARSRRPGGLISLAAEADYAGGMTANQDGTYKL